MALRERLPRPARRALRWVHDMFWQAVSPVRFGLLYRVEPVSRRFGFDRGLPIERYYIEKFLSRHADDIRGHVLEVADASYTRRFGGDRVRHSDVLHVATGTPAATLVGNLETGEGIPAGVFDCVILTQTLPVIYEFARAIGSVYRALKPGGVLLASLPGISQITRYDMDRWGDYWRFTDASARRMFERAFGAGAVELETYGNVLVACAYLHGLASHELRKRVLEHRDRDYQLLIAVRARKVTEPH